MQVQESSLTQLPNEYMQVYCGRYTDAGGDRFFRKRREVHTHRYKVADVKVQVEVKLLKTTAILFFLNFLVERPGSMD